MGFIFGVFYGFAVLFALAVAPEQFDNPLIKLFALGAIVFWGTLYWYAGESKLKAWFGFAKILAGLWTSWTQMSVAIAARGWKDQHEGIAFICLSIAAIASGLKDIKPDLTS